MCGEVTFCHHKHWPCSICVDCCWTFFWNCNYSSRIPLRTPPPPKKNQLNNCLHVQGQCFCFFFNVGRLTKEEQLQHREEAQTQTIVGIVKKEITWQNPHYRQAGTKGTIGRLMASGGAVQFSGQSERKAGKNNPDPPERSGLLTGK